MKCHFVMYTCLCVLSIVCFSLRSKHPTMRRRDVIDVDLLFMKKTKEERNYDMIVMVNYFCNISIREITTSVM